MNRDLILIGGGPGSGRSHLGKSLAQELHTQMSVEHLSTGDTIRAIGRGVLRSYYAHDVHTHLKSSDNGQPIDDVIMYNIIEEMLERADGTELILLDGYPANQDQVRDLFELAVFDNRTIAGLLQTAVGDDVAVMRMIKRRPRNYDGQLTVTAARERLVQRSRDFKMAALELSLLDVPLELIDTSGPKDVTTRHGLLAVQQFIDMSDDRRSDAS